MPGDYTHVTDANFADAVLQSNVPVIVDFWAPWCQPCLRMAPIFEQLAGDYHGKVAFMKLNTDDNPTTPGRFGIQGIPTSIIFSGGREIDRIVGLRTRDDLKRHLEAALGAAA